MSLLVALIVDVYAATYSTGRSVGVMLGRATPARGAFFTASSCIGRLKEGMCSRSAGIL